MTTKTAPFVPLPTEFRAVEDKPVRWAADQYQLEACAWLVTRQSAALFLDPGLGKTAITLAAISYLMNAGKIKKVLVIAPLRVCHLVWPAEIKKWADFNHLKLRVLHGPDKQKELDKKADIYVINPEGLRWLTENTRVFKNLHFDVLVVDELTKFKNTKTQRFKQMKSLLQTFKYRWGLTGSPAANGLEHLFGQVYMLDGGLSLGRYITHYRNEYFKVDHSGFKYIPTPGSAERIYEKLKPICLRMAIADYVDMPIFRMNEIKVTLPDEAMSLYNEFEEELVIEVQNETVTAVNAAIAAMKCRQVSNGAIYKEARNDDRYGYVEIHKTKIEALIDLVDELQGQPLLVAYEFQHDLDRLIAVFPDAKYLGKGQRMSEAIEIEKQWNNGEIELLFGQPQSMGHGLNLQKNCHNIAWFTPSWDLELFDQFNDRVYRRGNASPTVVCHVIIALNTVDELVMKSLRKKENVQKNLFEALKK